MYWNLATGVFGLPTFNKYTCARSPHLSVCGAYGYPLFHHVEHLYKSGAVSAISDNHCLVVQRDADLPPELDTTVS